MPTASHDVSEANPKRQTDRLRAEQVFHDTQARRRAAALTEEGLRFADDAYLDHESWIRPALAQLGGVQGKRILDFGCGHGMAAAVLARRGAQVFAFDLSAGYLTEASARARANQVEVGLVQANGEELPFGDEVFDGIWGNAILHHLDLEKTGREIRRVLVPGGVAVFCEPWGGNPLLAWARRGCPYPGKERTPDEQPLCSADLTTLRQVFPELEVHGQQFLGMIGRLLGRWRTWKGLAECDRLLLRRCPLLARYCRYATLILRKCENH